MKYKYTTTLPKESFDWLASEAKRSKVPTNALLVAMIEEERAKEKAKTLADGFARMKKDCEMEELADMGVSEYADSLKSYD